MEYAIPSTKWFGRICRGYFFQIKAENVDDALASARPARSGTDWLSNEELE